MKCSIGRMECCKRDAYDTRKHTRRTPCLPHIIFHLFTFYVFNLLSVRLSFTRVLACFRLFTNNYFEFTVLCWYTCLVNVSRDVRAVQPLWAFRSMSHGSHADFLPCFFPTGFFFWEIFSGLCSYSIFCKLLLSSVLVYLPHVSM